MISSVILETLGVEMTAAKQIATEGQHRPATCFASVSTVDGRLQVEWLGDAKDDRCIVILGQETISAFHFRTNSCSVGVSGGFPAEFDCRFSKLLQSWINCFWLFQMYFK